MATEPVSDIAVWVVTPNGLNLGRALRQRWPEVTIFASERLTGEAQRMETIFFDHLSDAVEMHFHRFRQHIFIMATGIVVRSVARVLKSKLTDPAVVTMDDLGTFAISLVSGHLGGANRLAQEAADALSAIPVITTATDVNRKPAIDLLAQQHRLKIENPAKIKGVNMALLTGRPIVVHDPGKWLGEDLPGSISFHETADENGEDRGTHSEAGVWVDDRLSALPSQILVLRPPSLAAGIGCNRNAPLKEIRQLLFDVLERYRLSVESLAVIASVDLKSNEGGLLALAEQMILPLEFFTRSKLAGVKDIPSPSTTVVKHIGVPSVCEAAAILASRHGQLIIPKQKTKNVTVAIARRDSTSSV